MMSEIPYLTPLTGTSSLPQEGLGPLFLLSLDLLVGFWQKLSTTTDTSTSKLRSFRARKPKGKYPGAQPSEKGSVA